MIVEDISMNLMEDFCASQYIVTFTKLYSLWVINMSIFSFLFGIIITVVSVFT